MMEIRRARRMGERPIGLPAPRLFDDRGEAEPSMCLNVHADGDRQEKTEWLSRASDYRRRVHAEGLPPLAIGSEPISGPLTRRREVELAVALALVSQKQLETGRLPQSVRAIRLLSRR